MAGLMHQGVNMLQCHPRPTYRQRLPLRCHGTVQPIRRCDGLPRRDYSQYANPASRGASVYCNGTHTVAVTLRHALIRHIHDDLNMQYIGISNCSFCDESDDTVWWEAMAVVIVQPVLRNLRLSTIINSEGPELVGSVCERTKGDNVNLIRLCWSAER